MRQDTFGLEGKSHQTSTHTIHFLVLETSQKELCYLLSKKYVLDFYVAYHIPVHSFADDDFFVTFISYPRPICRKNELWEPNVLDVFS